MYHFLTLKYCLKYLTRAFPKVHTYLCSRGRLSQSAHHLRISLSTKFFKAFSIILNISKYVSQISQKREGFRTRSVTVIRGFSSHCRTPLFHLLPLFQLLSAWCVALSEEKLKITLYNYTRKKEMPK